MKLLDNFLIRLIKIYKYLLSPLMAGPSCRYEPTCSNYFIDSIKINGSLKGSYLGIKRILSCHPLKFFGGGEGYDPVQNLKNKK